MIISFIQKYSGPIKFGGLGCDINLETLDALIIATDSHKMQDMNIIQVTIGYIKWYNPRGQVLEIMILIETVKTMAIEIRSALVFLISSSHII